MSPFSCPESTQSLSNPKPINGFPRHSRGIRPPAATRCSSHLSFLFFRRTEGSSGLCSVPHLPSPALQSSAPAGCGPTTAPTSSAPSAGGSRTPPGGVRRTGNRNTHWVGLLCSKCRSAPRTFLSGPPTFPTRARTGARRRATPRPERAAPGTTTPTHPGRPTLPQGSEAPPGGGAQGPPSWQSSRAEARGIEAAHWPRARRTPSLCAYSPATKNPPGACGEPLHPRAGSRASGDSPGDPAHPSRQ